MDVFYLGHSSFRLVGKPGSVVIDPYDSLVLGEDFKEVSAELVLVTHDHKDHNRVDLVSGVKKVIDGPGEYEIGGVSVIGIPSWHDSVKGKERGENTIYVIEMEGLRICHLGDLGHPLAEGQVEQLGSIDILMVPVGGFYTIGAESARDVVSALEPKVIIPMHYKEVSGKLGEAMASVDEFLKLVDVRTERLPKLSIKAGNLPLDQLVALLAKK